MGQSIFSSPHRFDNSDNIPSQQGMKWTILNPNTAYYFLTIYRNPDALTSANENVIFLIENTNVTTKNHNHVTHTHASLPRLYEKYDSS